MLYISVSLLLSIIPVNKNFTTNSEHQNVFLSTNGVHLDIVLPIEMASPALLNGIYLEQGDHFISIGWGEEKFYLNTPQWSDLSIQTAVNAAFLDNTTLLHITRYQKASTSWKKVPLNQTQLKALNDYILRSFRLKNGKKERVLNSSYSMNDEFYKANGTYSFHQTCNSWVNQGLKECGLRAALWTPFDFGVLWKYE